MQHWLDQIEISLNNIVQEYSEGVLKDAIGYSLLNGGKRLRPLLLLTTLSDLNIDPMNALHPACAIEMIHTYSLIHDDLPSMDNDTLRRGKPTSHIVFGEANAILAGDALLTDSFRYFTNVNIEPEKKVEIINLASRYAGGFGMVYGQVLDMMHNSKTAEIATIEEIHRYKTQKLIALPIEIAAIIGDVSSLFKQQLEHIAYLLGISFQQQDDLIDRLDTSEVLGKDQHSDVKNDKATMVQLLGVESSIITLKNTVQTLLNLIEQLLGKKDLYHLVEKVFKWK